jgi:mxaA protein
MSELRCHSARKMGLALRGTLLAVVCGLLEMGPTAPTRAAEAREAPRLEVRNPRPFGYVIGDRLEQQIAVEVPSALSLVTTSLPNAGRASVWLQRQRPRVATRRAGGMNRYEIAIDYQVVNVPEQIRTIELPELQLRFAGARQSTEAVVTPWPITVAPVTPLYVLSRAGLGEMRPDAPARLIETRPLLLRTLMWAIALSAIGAYAVISRFGVPFLARRHGPFARALSDLRRLARASQDEATQLRAMQRLHRAFDETAGHAVFAGQLARFFALHGEFEDTRAEAERFFRTSREEFFGDARTTHSGAPASIDAVLALARRCRDAERAAV